MVLEFGRIERTQDVSKPAISVGLIVSSDEIAPIHPLRLTLHGHDLEGDEITDTCLYINISKNGAERLASLLLEMSNE